MRENTQNQWFPIATSDDLQKRHVYHGQLLGQEMAVWRADDGFVNIWENRCLHRGVRLSIGINDGRELKCQYHGWRYANRSAGCTYIPAHPADAPARTIKNKTYPAVEKYGLVWSCLDKISDLTDIEALRGRKLSVLRSIPVNAPADLVLENLANIPLVTPEGHAFQKSDLCYQDHALFLKAVADDESVLAAIFLQPIDSNRSVIRAVVEATPTAPMNLFALRHYDAIFSTARENIEAIATQLPPRKETEAIYSSVPRVLASLPEKSDARIQEKLRVTVRRKWEAARGVAGFELVPIEGILPVSQPGAHLDVTTSLGITRQYSIVNGPGEGQGYTIGVKLEPDSRGGSKTMHESVREGDLLAVSPPHNNFPLRRDAEYTIFIAGGIGITPLLSMAQTLQHQNLTYDLHYFAQSEDHLAFQDRLNALGSNLHTHLGFDSGQTAACLRDVLSNRAYGSHVYICGPGGMLTAARDIAAELGWPDEFVHFEYFKNTNEVDTSSSFEIALARSGLTLDVPAGQSILEVLRQNGVGIPSSCEQGACGTCLATVIEGEVDHQDVFLSKSEKDAGETIMTCVSRAKSKRLILDL